MKLVIYLHSLHGGGAERVASTLASAWAAAGHAVTLLTVDNAAGDVYPLAPGVSRRGLGLASRSVSPWRALLANLQRLIALRRALLDERPDATVGFMSTAAVQLALLRGLVPGVRIGSERSYPPQLPMGRVWEALRRWSYGWLDAVVAPTDKTARWLCANTRCRRAVVIANPLAWPLVVSAPVVAPEARVRAGRRVLLVVGRLSEEKQIDHAIDVFAQVAERHPDWDLVLLGDGPERLALHARAQASGFAGRIHFVGRVGNVGDWFARGELFLLVSRFEGFPNALAEALASGLASLAYDCDTGPRELITHEQSGLLVPPGDRHALGLALDRLLGDAALRRRLGAGAVAIRERCAADAVARGWTDLIENLARRA